MKLGGAVLWAFVHWVATSVLCEVLKAQLGLSEVFLEQANVALELFDILETGCTSSDYAAAKHIFHVVDTW